jgi:hypothetical protein
MATAALTAVGKAVVDQARSAVFEAPVKAYPFGVLREETEPTPAVPALLLIQVCQPAGVVPIAVASKDWLTAGPAVGVGGGETGTELVKSSISTVPE